jgi:phage protein D
MTVRGAVYDGLSPNAIVSVLPKKNRKKPIRYLGDRLIQTIYTDSGRRSTTKIDLSLRNDDESLFYDADLMRKGTILGLRLGFPGLMIDAGQFVIKNHSGDMGTLKITATERKRSKMTRKKLRRYWEGVPRSTAVREVLRNHFPDGHLHIEDTKDPIDSITQRNEHDWQFCYRQAQLAQYEMYIDETGLHWEKPKRNSRPSRYLRFIKNPIGLGEIISYSFEGLSTGIPGRFTLKGKDHLTKKPFSVSVTKASVTENIELVETLGADDPDEGDLEDRGDTGHEIVRNTGAKNLVEAKELAQAMFKESRWGGLKMSLETIGDPTVRSRRVVAIYGIGPALDGLWWVKTVTHTIGGDYKQKIDLTREGLAKKLKIKRGKAKTTAGRMAETKRTRAAHSRQLTSAGGEL